MLSACKVLLCLVVPLLVRGDCQSCKEACNDPACSQSSLYYCYNPQLETCVGRPLAYGDSSPKWCAFDCSGGLVLYYDCELGSKPSCPPSTQNATVGDFVALSEGFNTDQSVADEYITNAQGLDQDTRQQAYVSAVNAIAAAAYATTQPEASAYKWEFELDLHNTTTKKQLRAGLEKLPLFRDNGTASLSDGVQHALAHYVLQLSSTPFGKELSRTGKIGGFLDFCKSVIHAVGTVIHKAFDWCTANPVQGGVCAEVGKKVACVVSTFFGFPVCLGSPLAQQAPVPRFPTSAGYEPICLSKCQSCLEYVVPGYNDVWCKYDDYKDMPNDGLCLQSCPTQTRSQLLGEATSLKECWDLCKI